MSIIIRRGRDWFARHPKARQWAWFVLLWCGGLLAVSAIAYPIKWAVKSIG